MKKIAKNFRLDQGTINLLNLLSEITNMNNTEVIEQAIRNMANQECTKDEIFNAYYFEVLKEVNEKFK